MWQSAQRAILWPLPLALRQLFMNALRSVPFSPFVLASALQLFIFSVWLLALGAAEPEAPVALVLAPAVVSAPFSDRQLFMNALRSAPISPFAFASALQVVIFSCWLFGCEA